MATALKSNPIVKASAMTVHHSPRKVGEVIALIRNRTVADALVILSHTPRRSTVAVAKLLESAKANAANNHSLVPESLVITEIYVTPGVRMKRYRPIARGSAHPYQRKTSHIFVAVTGDIKKAKASSTVKTTSKKTGKTTVKSASGAKISAKKKETK